MLKRCIFQDASSAHWCFGSFKWLWVGPRWSHRAQIRSHLPESTERGRKRFACFGGQVEMNRLPLVLFGVLVMGLFTPGGAVLNNLTCYKCLVETNELCTQDDLKPCANDQAYDVCVTILRKTEKDGFHIEKKCGLGPCSLDRKGIQLPGLDHCDRSQSEFECMSCCKSNGCNASDGDVPLDPRFMHKNGRTGNPRCAHLSCSCMYK